MTADGATEDEDAIIIAMGAWAPQIVDYGRQAWPGMSTITTIKLSEEEIRSVEKMPVMNIITPGAGYHQVAGYILPPNADGLLKVVGKA
jgi:glycine/D-amino acid oxidase-like deaminating enzyme